jgi:hypothetical protein
MCEAELRAYLGGLSKARVRAAVRAHELPGPQPVGGKPMWCRIEVDRTIARRRGLPDDSDTSVVEQHRDKALEAARALSASSLRVRVRR